MEAGGRRVTRATARGANGRQHNHTDSTSSGNSLNDLGGRTSHNTPNNAPPTATRGSFISRLAAAQSLDQEDVGYDHTGLFSNVRTGATQRLDLDEDTELAAVQERESLPAGPATRRLFHQFREPRHSGSHRMNGGHRGNHTDSEESDISAEESYLATHAIAMAQQHNAFTSPSVSLSTSAAATLNSVGRHMSIQEIHEMQDEEIEEEYEENSADGNGVDIEVEDDMHHEEEEEEEEEDEEGDEDEFDQEALRDPASHGLKEISNLGRFTVSSQKQGNGVEELRSDDLKLYWQSDGPQPHKLTVYFIKRVSIRTIRFYVNYKEDESYTPTKIVFKSGTGENTLIEFASVELSTPVGWQDVPVFGCGGGLDGNTLVSYVFQMVILENHQNGKDTHLRGIKIYAQEHEERALGGDGLPAIDMEHMNLTPGFDSRGRPATVIANSWTPMAAIAMTNCETDEPKTEAELAKRKKVAQDAALDEWISDSLIRGPNSVTSLSLR